MSNSFQRLAGVVALAVAAWSVPAADMTLVGTHPTAALAGVPELSTLKTYDGRIYIGHGEWNSYRR